MKNLLLTAALVLPSFALAEDVTVANLVRAETDHMMRENMRVYGVEIGEMIHLREPTTPDNQAVIRMNQDTLYSGLLLDLSKPVQLTMPEVDGRYMSMMVISQDHYITSEATPGTYELTEENVGSRFAFVAFRTFADVTDPADIAAAHAAQDAIAITGGGDGPFEAPDWNLDQLDMARKRSAISPPLGSTRRLPMAPRTWSSPSIIWLARSRLGAGCQLKRLFMLSTQLPLMTVTRRTR